MVFVRAHPNSPSSSTLFDSDRIERDRLPDENMGPSVLARQRIAVLIPCYNEALSIAKVVQSFKGALPDAEIYVYDNNSTDQTVEAASRAGAIVRQETRQGKGNVVRRMFADVDADFYVMVDGDATYDAAIAPALLRELRLGGNDLVNVARKAQASEYRPGHAVGNTMISGLVKIMFGSEINDMLSGYKAFSRRYVRSFPALSRGFEIETELVVHALAQRMPISEIYAPYQDREVGSESKLRTFRDGFRILSVIGFLIKEERPFFFFSMLAAFFALASTVVGIPVVFTYLETGLVPRLPTAILALGLSICSLLSISCGLILDSVTRGRREAKRWAYLSAK